MKDKNKVVAVLDQLEAEGMELLCGSRAEAANIEYAVAHRMLNQMGLHFASGLISFGMAYLRNKIDDKQQALKELEDE